MKGKNVFWSIALTLLALLVVSCGDDDDDDAAADDDAADDDTADDDAVDDDAVDDDSVDDDTVDDDTVDDDTVDDDSVDDDTVDDDTVDDDTVDDDTGDDDSGDDDSSDDFESDTVGDPPAGWDIQVHGATTFLVENAPGKSVSGKALDMYIGTTSSDWGYASHDLAPGATGDITFWFDILLVGNPSFAFSVDPVGGPEEGVLAYIIRNWEDGSLSAVDFSDSETATIPCGTIPADAQASIAVILYADGTYDVELDGALTDCVAVRGLHGEGVYYASFSLLDLQFDNTATDVYFDNVAWM